jgi:uncharacterized protein (DUF2147 family)
MFLKTFSATAQATRALSAIIVIAISGVAAAQSSLLTPVGLWRNIDDKTGQARAEIRITADSKGVLTGVIEKALLPGQEPICSECSDDRKGQPKLGMEIIRGAHQAEGKTVWEGGKILDPDNGKNYTLRLTPIEGGSKLEVRGSFGPFGRTQTWTRIQ